MQRFWLILIVLFYLISFNSAQAQTTNAGFIPGNIWYSKDPFEEGDKINIYTVLFNTDTREFSGTVIFFDGNIFLGKDSFAVPARGVKDASISWMVTAGNHNIFAKIENAKFLISAGKYEEVYLAGNQTEESKTTVSKKIPTTTNITTNTIENVKNTIVDTATGSVDSIKNLVSGNTPETVTTSINNTSNILENVRSSVGAFSEKKRASVKKDIANLNNKTATKDTTVATKSKNKIDGSKNTDKYVKPFKYVELAALAMLSTTFNNKYVFYGLIILVLFLFLRFLWRKFF